MACASCWRPTSDTSPRRRVPGSQGKYSSVCMCWQLPPRLPRMRVMVVLPVVVLSQEQRSRTL
eukprot:9423697-Pyramimonas_sp.AAC.1